MPERALHGTASDDTFSGQVREWHSEEGWGVLVSPTLSGDVWAHFSVIEAEGFRELTAGQAVTFAVEQAEQDRFRWRAVWVRPSGVQPPSGDVGDPAGPGYSSDLDITFDDSPSDPG
ncbi:cold-shock protein [Streptomyces erythrochromogenes]|uniref:cold-shock protein n=1 Tax=Streptomyces erythrochromogenes TaxID=285574 RepID=UPI0036746229